MVSFGIPLFATFYLCGSVLTEVFFVIDSFTDIILRRFRRFGTMILSVRCLVFLQSVRREFREDRLWPLLGLITGVLGFDATGTALMLTIFALQDSFGTACNVTGDGALTMILTGYAKRHNIEEQVEQVQF